MEAFALPPPGHVYINPENLKLTNTHTKTSLKRIVKIILNALPFSVIDRFRTVAWRPISEKNPSISN